MNKISEDKAFKIAYELAIKAVEAGYLAQATDGNRSGEKIVNFISSIVDGLTQDTSKND